MTVTYPPLFSRDSKGKILVWNVEVNNTGTQVDIKMSYGEFNGALALKWKRDIKGKNIGKSNETYPFEQAQRMAESMVNRRIDQGYVQFSEFETPSFEYLQENVPFIKTDASGATKPMKCQQYYRSKKNWVDPTGQLWDDRKYFYLANPYADKEDDAIITKFPCIGQPKINGVRATIQLIEGKVKILSKEGKEYNIPHILDYFNMNIDMFEVDNPEGEDFNIVFDGELYIHGELLQDIGSAVKKVSLMTQRVVFILFDLAIPDICQEVRWNMLKEYKAHFDQTINCPIQLIRAFKVMNDAQAQSITDLFIKEGYEGSIFRQFTNKYSFGGRPTTITKLKRCISREFKIVDVIPQDVDPTQGLYVCTTNEGKRFKVTPKGTEAFKREVLDSRSSIIGKNLTVDFYEWTRDNLPFHVLNNTIRDYE